MKPQKGFNLVELMIATAVLAILSSAAVPAYNDYVVRSKVPDATSALSTMRSRMEQCFQDSHSYANCNCATSTKFFDISCGAQTNATYTLQAVGNPLGPMAGFTYTVNESNSRTSTIALPAPGHWLSPTVACWITRNGGQC